MLTELSLNTNTPLNDYIPLSNFFGEFEADNEDMITNTTEKKDIKKARDSKKNAAMSQVLNMIQQMINTINSGAKMSPARANAALTGIKMLIGKYDLTESPTINIYMNQLIDTLKVHFDDYIPVKSSMLRLSKINIIA
ncbi:MAG: hypothetical protein ABIH39_04425 [Candidatus Margulisiibacteriota bacterium]